MIQINHFYKAYNSRNEYAVEDVSIKVEKGKITGLLGPNGSGKTTIMKAVCGVHFPTKGEIIVSNCDIVKNPEKAMELTGYVPEISVLPSEMTVQQFLEYVCFVHNVPDFEQALKNVSKECGIEKLLNKKIKTLSKGQKQRVSFAQCLVYNPENLILDEPVSGLDPAQIQQMRELLKSISKTKAVLLSTHILQEINLLCDEVYILCNGKIAASGSEQEIVKMSGCGSLEEAFIKLTKNNENEE